MERCQDLKVLTLFRFKSLDEDHCRVLGTYSRPGLEIKLFFCRITSAGASALAEGLGRNQGLTKLACCELDNSVLANGLRGNSRIVYWRPLFSRNLEVGNQNLLAIADALKENKGLVDLDLTHEFTMTDETWDAICDSLKTHPTLEVLNLCSIHTRRFACSIHARMLQRYPLDPAVLMSRIQAWIKALVDMLKVNKSIHTIHVHLRYSENELFRRSVIPYLKTNWLRPRLLAIQRTRPIVYRAKVLGRALIAVRTDPDRFWMLLSNNAEVVFPSTTATTTSAANLSTPATVGASTSAADPVASTSPPPANSVALASGQKRKACP
jgi:hypothetical protein